MADCPGVLHLALMADGGLARLRTPGGVLTAGQAIAVAQAAERFGSGVVDLTNRANLQIRGLAPDAGPALSEALALAGFDFEGEADRRRNILLDPFSGADPDETQDMRPLARLLDDALKAAAWIERLSPKFSFALDGGGRSGIGATPSDVVALGRRDGIALLVGEASAHAASDVHAVAAMMAAARAASDAGPDARVRDLGPDMIATALSSVEGVLMTEAVPRPAMVAPRFGSFASRDGLAAVALPVPVGRLDAAMLRFLSEEARATGDGALVLAPWSAVVLPGVPAEHAVALLARSEAAGFPPVAVAERLTLVACAGAPACERAREPAKALAVEALALAAADRSRLPRTPRRVHLSACPKGCAGSAASDLLLLGSSATSGWTLHRGGRPRAPGPEAGRMAAPDAAGLLALAAADN